MTKSYKCVATLLQSSYLFGRSLDSPAACIGCLCDVWHCSIALSGRSTGQIQACREVQRENQRSSTTLTCDVKLIYPSNR
ncbi:hypothetical protein EGU77_28530 [Pseudomonas syringae pv. theae]|nr:hypothetical protein [Pseudomonas syringae pv. theae]MBL3870326.1 hypothetical protein [Pseudomonas syringae pv. theae]MBL3876135.1 hypothetical protein [Pseudomonas syringae pv. theae]